MRIDAQKTLGLVSALAIAAEACSSVHPSEAITIPEQCRRINTEALRPPTLSRQSVITYPGGAIINQAGSMVDLSVNIPTLLRINNSPDLALNFTPDTQNFTYFFAGSFRRPDAREQIVEFIKRDRTYLLYRYCQEQGVASGRARFSVISVADEFKTVQVDNPRTYPLTDPFWTRALTVQFALSYAARTKASTHDPEQIPTETPPLSSQERVVLIGLGLPFSITRLNPALLSPVRFD
ncbi:hypothetical protein HYU96_01785 [Candidatus Daviesbacteria bacterium]|nr:hypothetical protein [Candidatus Daviesbacteria bacterium]